MIRAWRDQPKPGETDAQWCALVAREGHVMFTTTGHASEQEAIDACAGREAKE